MRRVPSCASITSEASFRTLRCCETAGRVTARPAASLVTDVGRLATRSKTRRRVGSARAGNAGDMVSMAYGKQWLTHYRGSVKGLRAAFAGHVRDRLVFSSP